MATVRLTQDMRESIKTQLLAHAFGVREAELEEAKEELALAVYNDVYPEPLRAAMNALPAGFLPEQNDLYATFGDDLTEVKWGVNLRVSDDHSNYRASAKVYPPGHSLTKQFRHLQQLESQLDADRNAAKREARAVLKSCTTLKSLLAAWPEVEPFTRAFMPVKSNLPALPIASLNKQLGLPVAGADA